MTRILIVDDERKIAELLAERIAAEGMDAATAASAEEALPAIERGEADVVLCDLRLSGMDGIELLRRTKRVSPETDVVIMTAYASAETAVEAMRRGAYEYLIKPFQMDEVTMLLRRIIERRELVSENAALRDKLSARAGTGRLIGG
jgi:two-component system response regulator PilR (NtrC family)